MTDKDALLYSAEHEWIEALPETETETETETEAVVVIGITDVAADRLGDVVYLDLPAVGTVIAVGQVIGEVESTKSVSELYAPVEGEVVAVNVDAADDPAVVNSAPFGAGWLVRVRLSAPPDGLMDREAYLVLTGGAA